MREQTLDRLIRTGLKAVVIGIGLVAVIYFVQLRANTSPSLVERQIAAAEDSVRDQPNEVGHRLRLAELYRAAERPDDAFEQYDEVLDFESDQVMALLGRGELSAEQGQLAEAESSFRQVIGNSGGAEFSAVDPQLEAAHYGLASVMLKQGLAKKAMRAAKRAVAIEPTDADAWYLLGTAALEADAPRTAVGALRKAVLFVPSGWCEPYEGLSEAYGALGRRPHAQYASAMVDLCEERTDGAARRLKPLTSGPVAIDAMLGLGMVAEAESDRAGARRWYRKVLAADAGNFNARSGLNRLSAPGAG
jgi:tetratricopeptide (TPR) repeat protein